MTAPVEVGRYRWRHEAEIAQGLLDDAEILSTVVADDIGGAYAGIAPARLLVAPEDAERAREVLEGAGSS
ncbi:MAG: putative signal transducing protein [Gemmatimonadota bacterium]